MFLTEPSHTQYDFHFRLFGVPVRVHPLFWLFTVILGFNQDPKMVLLWVAAVFISILVHEMGHAMAIRWYGWSPSVVLYSLGGLAIHNPYVTAYSGSSQLRRNKWTQIVISLAGPFAGFLMAGLLIAILVPTEWVKFKIIYFSGTDIPFLLLPTEESKITNPYVLMFIGDMMYINIWWGLVNLLPIWPLDGGHVSRELFQMFDRREALRNSLVLSLVCAGGMVLLGAKSGNGFIAMMFVFMAISNYQDLTGGGRYGGGNPW
ncbi:metalloprotease [Blastopirellula marina]|uniref:Peptidase M50 domain-containing protein n=1 Tax=Blastopirellula marina TaxID=124 RepID=A0A2S8FCT9_9BACT|nr:site-2 protease family protein [Blastopirellula marina]PQO29983.1 hypothetical protein C5Y98_22235 [Blastopirellula marina]PTL42451.1 hypothetical protein C5Y97_22245 [Blastopirellula marina]